MTPNITANRKWSISSVSAACISNSLYTNGGNDAYSKMLDYVNEHKPTYVNIYKVAKDICNHSMYQTITNVMYILEQQAVITTFELDGQE